MATKNETTIPFLNEVVGAHGEIGECQDYSNNPLVFLKSVSRTHGEIPGNGANGYDCFDALPPSQPPSLPELPEKVEADIDYSQTISEKTKEMIEGFVELFDGENILIGVGKRRAEEIICSQEAIEEELQIICKQRMESDQIANIRSLFWLAERREAKSLLLSLYDQEQEKVLDEVLSCRKEAVIPVAPEQLVGTLSERSWSEIQVFVQQCENKKVQVAQATLELLDENTIREILQEVTSEIFQEQPKLNRTNLCWVARMDELNKQLILKLQDKENKRCIETLYFVMIDEIEDEHDALVDALESGSYETEPEPIVEIAEVALLAEKDVIQEYDFPVVPSSVLAQHLAEIFPEELGQLVLAWKLDAYSNEIPIPDNPKLIFKHNKTNNTWSVVFNDEEYSKDSSGPRWIKLVLKALNENLEEFQGLVNKEWKENSKVLEKLQKGNYVVEFADGTCRYVYASPKELRKILEEIGAKFEGETGEDKLIAGQHFEMIEEVGMLRLRVVIVSNERKQIRKEGPVLTLHELSDDEMKDRRDLLRARMTNGPTKINTEGVKAYGKQVILAVFEHERNKQAVTVEGLMKAYDCVKAKFEQMRDTDQITAALVEFWDIPEKTFKTDGLRVANILNESINNVLKEIVKITIAPALDEAVKNEVGGVVQMAELPRRSTLGKVGRFLGVGESDEERLTRIQTELEALKKKVKFEDLSNFMKLERLLFDVNGAYQAYLEEHMDELLVQAYKAKVWNSRAKISTKNIWNLIEGLPHEQQENIKKTAIETARTKFTKIVVDLGITSLSQELENILKFRIVTFQAKHEEAIALVSGVGGRGEGKKADEKVKTKEVEAVVDPQKKLEELMGRMTEEQSDFEDAIGLAEAILTGGVGDDGHVYPSTIIRD